MLGRHQPGQQLRIKPGAFTGLGKTPLDSDELIVLLGQRQRPIQTQYLPGERGAAGIAERSPDFIQFDFEFIHRRRKWRIGAQQAPIHLGAVARCQIANDLITHRPFGTQIRSGVEITAQAATTVGDVEKQFQALRRQIIKPRCRTGKANVPDPTQIVRQLLPGGVRQIDRGLARGDRKLLASQFTMCIKSGRQRGARECHARHEPASRDRHCPTCVSHEAGFIQARTFARRGNLRRR